MIDQAAEDTPYTTHFQGFTANQLEPYVTDPERGIFVLSNYSTFWQCSSIYATPLAEHCTLAPDLFHANKSIVWSLNSLRRCPRRPQITTPRGAPFAFVGYCGSH